MLRGLGSDTVPATGRATAMKKRVTKVSRRGERALRDLRPQKAQDVKGGFFGVPVTSSTSGTTGKPAVSELIITKQTDSSTP
jgi:hypothetical protein